MTKSFKNLIESSHNHPLGEDVLDGIGLDSLYNNKKKLKEYATYLYSFYEGIFFACERTAKLRNYNKMKCLKNYLTEVV